MCVKIYFGEQEIETPRQFREHFGFEAPKQGSYNYVDIDCCLCQVDVGKALNEHNIAFKKDWGDIYVGEPQNEVVLNSA